MTITMINRSLIIQILLTFLIYTNGYSQSKPIKVSGDYYHKKTNAYFPIKIDDYSRSSIISYDKTKENLSVSYSNQTSKGKTTFTIYIYPAGDGSEGRLRKEFKSSLSAITYIDKPGNTIQKSIIDFQKDGYKINGIKAMINDNNGRSDLLLYECGLWFLKLRVSSQNFDSLEIANLENKIIDRFCPIDYVRLSPLNLKADIYFAKAAFVDSLMLGSVMGSALKKVSWAIENVDSLERISGFPDLYLDLHKAALLEFVKFEKDHPKMSKSPSTIEYLAELNSIIENGFLNEFILQQFDNLMIISPNQNLDLLKFEEWKKTNPIKINLNQYYAIVGYGK